MSIENDMSKFLHSRRMPASATRALDVDLRAFGVDSGVLYRIFHFSFTASDTELYLYHYIKLSCLTVLRIIRFYYTITPFSKADCALQHP